MPFSNSTDYEVAVKVLQALQSEKYKQKSFLFLEPFDTSQTPGYLETIGKPLDLQTISKNLEDDIYDENTFWKDLSNVFNNAIKYHSDKPTKWIAQMATSMLKYMNKERKRAEMGGLMVVENEEGTGSAGIESNLTQEKKKIKNKLKIKLKNSQDNDDSNVETPVAGISSASSSPAFGSSKPKIKIKKQKSMPIQNSSPPSRTADDDDDNSRFPVSEPPMKKPKLKLKLGSSASSKLNEDLDQKFSNVEKSRQMSSESDKIIAPATVKSSQQQVQPKIKLKLSLKSKKVTGDNEVIDPVGSSGEKQKFNKNHKRSFSFEEDQEVKKDKKKKLSLDNSSPKVSSMIEKKESPIPDAVASLSSSGSTVRDKHEEKKQQNNNTNKNSSTVPKLSVKLNPGNRGKELPKAIIASQQLEQAAAAGNSNSSSTSAPQQSSQQTSVGTKTGKKRNKLTLKKSASTLTPTGSSTQKQSSDGTLSESTKRNSLPSSDKVAKTKGLGGSSSTHGGGGGSGSGSSGDANSVGKDRAYLHQKQCSKVLSGLRRRQQKNVKWFALPIADKKILPEYNAKIKHPMDLQTLQSNLDKGLYNTDVPAFCLDLRRIFANALQFNTVMKDSLRPVAIEVLQTADDLLQVFLSVDKVGPQQACQPLLYCWKLCIDILNTIYKLENASDGQPLALYFFHPVTYYCLGETPPGYSEKVKKPMDFGTVTANLVEGRYQSVDSFANDCRLVITNCIAYHEGREDGKVYVDQANKLNECLSQQLDQLSRYDKSPKAASDRLKAKEYNDFPKPPPSLLSSILSDLRSLKYTDKATKITQPCMSPFEEPVSTTAFPDYMQHIREKMDLQIIDKRVKSGGYEMAEDFEYDVSLMFKNFEVYNSRKNAHHAVAMAKFASRKFRLLFMGRMRSFEDPTSMPPPKVLERQDSILTTESKPEKAKSTSPSSSGPSGNKARPEAYIASKKKPGPRISIPAINAASIPPPSSSSPGSTSRSKSPATIKMPTVSSSSSATVPKLKLKPNQPIPLHIAIARVKEGFPIRRAVKTLQSWEADCARYFKELMRHPWISAARPKFIFHVPVPVLFPDLCDTYAAKIKYPMDLTTIECSLLSGNKYSGPEDFVNDVALVFTNAIRFNKDGRDIGDPLSCAYYDASVHLLRYSRWLSLEVLSDYVDDSDHADTPGPDGLPPYSWSLTSGNRLKAREEMESLVLKEHIDISLEGDRWTWHEAECEKLLKALRHQSDLKYMTFFIAPNYPHDYAAYISKPMDWEKVQRMLKKRQYRVFGDLIDDLRLIFSNALKYNSKHQGTDNVSGRAYEAAIYMSSKLESAINKMMLTVSDRLERERIDHANAEREIEAAERAEEAQIAAAWKKEPDAKEGSDVQVNSTTGSNMSLKIRNVRRLAYQQNTDFEIPFFDEEDDGQHESSYFEVVKFQKAMFEKQRQDLLNTRKLSKTIGLAVIGRHIQNQMARQWVEEASVQEKEEKPSIENANDCERNESVDRIENSLLTASAVLSELERDDRVRVQIKLKFPKSKKILKHKKIPMLNFDTLC